MPDRLGAYVANHNHLAVGDFGLGSDLNDLYGSALDCFSIQNIDVAVERFSPIDADNEPAICRFRSLPIAEFRDAEDEAGFDLMLAVNGRREVWRKQARNDENRCCNWR